jgi:hypothetical protein
MLRRFQRKGNARKERNMFEKQKLTIKAPSEINAQGMLARGCVDSQKRPDWPSASHLTALPIQWGALNNSNDISAKLGDS